MLVLFAALSLTFLGAYFYFWCFCVKNSLNLNVSPTDRVIYGCIFLCLFLLFVISFLRCSFERQEKIAVFLEKLKQKYPQVFEKISMGTAENKRFCQTCQILKTGRLHHCRRSKQCVPSYDHYCPWLNSAIGRHNYRLFFLQAFYGCILGCFVFGTLLYHLVVSLIGDSSYMNADSHAVKSKLNRTRATLGNRLDADWVSFPYQNEVYLSEKQSLIDHRPINMHNENLNGTQSLEMIEKLPSNLEHNAYISSEWIDIVHWTQLVALVFTISLSCAVFICLGELSVRYFRYIKFGITMMDDGDIVYSKELALSNIKRILGDDPVMWFVPLYRKYIKNITSYSGFYDDGREIILE